jgi:holliday junction DNA helicase RuvB
MSLLERFAGWVLSPLLNGLIIKEDINVSNSKYIFRPQNFWEYIGQERAKERLYYYIKGIKERNEVFPHTLICGESGMGKTTLAQIIAKELNATFISCIASDLKNIETINEKIRQVNGGIFFQDEIHSLPRELAEKMYPIMEDFTNDGLRIKPFTLIGATTEIGEILRNRKPLVNRFGIILELENYTIDDLVKMAQQYKEKMFFDDILEENVYEIVARNCRNNPRTLLNILKSTIYFNGDIKKVLDNFGIMVDGLTKRDFKILKYITLNEKGVGLEGIANYLGTSADNYTYEIEPFLLQNELVVKTPRGRKITQKGKDVLSKFGEG